MKKILFVAMVFIAGALASPAFANGIGNYSNGERLGMITKFSVKGIFSKSGEGAMMVGNESGPLVITETDKDGNTVKKVINPWKFSVTNPSMIKQIDNSIGEYVVLTYQQAHVRNALATDTEYTITGVKPVSKNKLTSPCESTKFIKGNRSEGKRMGRIVKASSKGTMSNSYEITLQEGTQGIKFKDLSVTDPKMYECAQKVLRSGQLVTVTYSQSIVNLEVFSRNTTYDIVRIAPAKSGLSE